MAGSRLEKIGTIFSRTTGLLRTGAMKLEDKPIWYNVYAMHPPKEEARYDRPAPQIEVRDIFYEEDLIRAKFHKRIKHVAAYTLNDKQQTQTQKFIDIYKKLKTTEDVDDEKLFELALKQLHEKNPEDNTIDSDLTRPEKEEKRSKGLSESFRNAQKSPNKHMSKLFDL